MKTAKLIVIDSDGVRATLESDPRSSTQASVLLPEGRRILIPSAALHPQGDVSYLLGARFRDFSVRPVQTLTVPAIEETLEVRKRARDRRARQ
ncbi:MAG: hypothetical protein HY308_08410 [Gammaproteobacteria bacterium]|nr:hypothetical protein [Gammaproteobacteria bacterium]